MSSRLDTIWIAELVLSFSVVGTFVTWNPTNEMNNKFFGLKKKETLKNQQH